MKYKLGELVQIKYGKDHKKLEDGNIPVYGTGGLMRKVNDFLYSGESVLIPRKGSLNHVMFVTDKFWTVDTMFWTKIDNKKVLPKYLYYCLSKLDLSALNVGSAVPSLTVKILNEINLEIPSLDSQRKVIKKIEPIERKIVLNNQINDNLLELAKASYRKVLAASNLTETKLKDFATITMGQSPSSKTYNEDKVGLALLNGAADFRNGIHPSKWTTDPKRIVNKGSYIFGVRATIGLTTKVFDKYAIGRGTGSAVSKDTVNDEFLYFVLDDMFKYFSNSGTGSVYINISKSDFNDYIFCKPQTNDLQKFHQTVGPIMNKIYTNKQENLILTQVKETLLNKYF